MENITETSVKELLYNKLIFRLEIPEIYKIELEPIEGSLVRIEEIIARNIKRLKSLHLEENESRVLDEWTNTENIVKKIIDRIPLVVTHYKELDEKKLVPEKDILEKLLNGTVNIVEDGSKYYTSLTVNSYCDFDQSYELIIEFIEYFREKYKNNQYFYSAMNNFITINKDNNYIGNYFSTTYYYQNLPAIFWLRNFVKTTSLDTSKVDAELKKLEGFIKSEYDQASKIQINSKKFFLMEDPSSHSFSLDFLLWVPPWNRSNKSLSLPHLKTTKG